MEMMTQIQEKLKKLEGLEDKVEEIVANSNTLQLINDSIFKNNGAILRNLQVENYLSPLKQDQFLTADKVIECCLKNPQFGSVANYPGRTDIPMFTFPTKP